MYKNTHPNSIHIVVDGTLKQINSGEEFYSKTPLNYDFVNKIYSKPKKIEKAPSKKKRVKDVNKSTS